MRVKLEQEKMEQERKARLLAAQIAAVKMEIQDRKAKYRARKQADMHRRVMVEEQQAEAGEAQPVRSRRWPRSRSSATPWRRSSPHTPPQHGVLKQFTIDSAAQQHTSAGPARPPTRGWSPSPASATCCAWTAEFNIVAQPDHRRVRLKQHPFAKGGLRLAYFCEDITQPAHPFRLVAKESVYVGAKANSLSNFYNDVRCQLVARTFAQRFNRAQPAQAHPVPAADDLRVPLPQRRGPALHGGGGVPGRVATSSTATTYGVHERRVPFSIPAFCHWSWAEQRRTDDDHGPARACTTFSPTPSCTARIRPQTSAWAAATSQAMVDFFRARIAATRYAWRSGCSSTRHSRRTRTWCGTRGRLEGKHAVCE